MSNEFTYICCPYCSHARIKKLFMKRRFDINPLDFYILTVREQRSGLDEKGFFDKKQAGFFNIEGRERTIIDLFNSEDPEEREIAQAIIDRLKVIIGSYTKAGLI